MNRFKLAAAVGGFVVALGGCAGPSEPMFEPVTPAPRGDNPNLPLPQTATPADSAPKR